MTTQTERDRIDKQVDAAMRGAGAEHLGGGSWEWDMSNADFFRAFFLAARAQQAEDILPDHHKEMEEIGCTVGCLLAAKDKTIGELEKLVADLKDERAQQEEAIGLSGDPSCGDCGSPIMLYTDTGEIECRDCEKIFDYFEERLPARQAEADPVAWISREHIDDGKQGVEYGVVCFNELTASTGPYIPLYAAPPTPAPVVPEWRSVENDPPDNYMPSMPVMGYSPDWVDEDFNPLGIRECFPQFCDSTVERWISAVWMDEQDDYIADVTSCPTRWMPYPAAPQPEQEEVDHE